MSANYSVTLLCETAGVSRSGYYKWLKRQGMVTPKQKEDAYLKELILSCHQKMKGIYGYYRVKTWLLRQHQWQVNHKRVYRLMKELGIQATIRRKKRYFKRQAENLIVPNRLNRVFQASRPNEKWATDITYLLFNNQRLYLSVVYDLYNNEVISHQISHLNDLNLVLHTIKKAAKKRDVRGTLLHSDQGSQYTSRQYHKLLKEYGIIPSMSRKGNCLDNACIESFFGHLKSELMYLHSFKRKEEVIREVRKYIRFYNHNRFQAKLNNLSPIEYRAKAA